MSIIRRQGIKSIVYTYVGVGIGFITSILILTHALNKEQYGLVQVLITLPVLFTEYIGLGFSTVMTRMFVYFKDKTKAHHGFMFLSLVWFIFGLFVFLLAFYFFSGLIIGEKNSLLLKPYIFYAIPLTIGSHLFLVMERYLRYIHFNASFSIFLKEIVLRIGVLISAFLYYFNIVNFNQFIFFYCLSNILPGIILLIKLILTREISFKPQLDFLNRALLFKILKIALFAIGIGMIANLAQSFTQLTLSKLVSLSAVSSYSIAMIFGGLISVPMRVSHSLADPLLRQAFTIGDKSKVLEIYRKSCMIQTILGLYFYLCVLLNIDHIIQILPPIYADGKFMILIICLGTLFDMMTGVNDAIIGTSPKYHYSSIFPVALAAFTISFNLILIPKIGVNGAALASMCTLFLYNILRFLFILIILKLQPYNFDFLKIIGLAIIVGLVIFYIPKIDYLIIDVAFRTGLISLLWIGFIYKFKFSVDINHTIDFILIKVRSLF